jgi:hypothetical protein
MNKNQNRKKIELAVQKAWKILIWYLKTLNYAYLVHFKILCFDSTRW